MLQAIEPIQQVFQGRHHQHKAFFARKWPKNAKNLPQISVFWVLVVAWCPPPPPIFRVLDPKKDVFHPIEATSQLFSVHVAIFV